ncbi:WD40/YVTN/BNR-like repeat-containing protein [Thauera linaloolentis]|uniref:Glycosyl hydrolase n=1 Tax=Thauera linaloolentis (strain DSM 12138 / JCM 21573 / CCUG 41526 / CIP 105981 / IAM 15112 / NBRC 102519 / 47Lol) TaxID=1123367 RepID=N6YTR4_THAL4|nr:YCF48-related protein [Thauera linaloolentis]ENO85573.1 glycosyl hydrolase [Thauera linaloolentis 47Lol = DSM 12138]MCM8566531.1 YCF48-related protein [Thauera linaloolentis]
MKIIDTLRVLLGSAALGLAANAAWGAFEDPLQAPALANVAAARSPLVGVASAGDLLMAVGQRGVAVVSHDAGQNWTQAAVPVRTDLLAVHFPTPDKGWAVGQGGVVIHSADGGRSWTKQLDGQSASQRIIEYYAQAGAEGAEAIERERSLAELGGTQPFMGVYFEDERRGYVVGTFNRILRTEDGGRTWEPLGHRVDNPDELHFYGIAGGVAGLAIVGEQGMVWMYDAAEDRFVQRPTGYHGTLFGIVAGRQALIAYGMRGSVYRSADLGMSWERVAIDGHAGVAGGAELEDGRILLANLAGGLLLGDARAERFQAFRAASPMSYSGVAADARGVLSLVGAEGVRMQAVGTLQAAGDGDRATR